MSNLIKRNFVGQWVRFSFFKNQSEVGFIVDFVGDAAKVMIPATKVVRTIPLSRLADYELNLISKKELEQLLDLALLTNDIDWAQEIYNRMKAVEQDECKADK